MKCRIDRVGLVIASIVVIASQAKATQLLVNPSFELPVIGASTCSGFANCEGFNVGDNIGGWTVVGPGAGSGFAVVSETSAFTDGIGDHYSAEDGNQSLDLTGSGNQGANGVAQTVVTTPGASYVLSFFVGNEDNSLPNFGLNSAIKLLINGVSQGTFTSSGNVFHDLSWASFTFDFTAATASTSLEFLNATPSADFEAGLDNVTLAPAVDLPEPGSLGMMAFGVVMTLGLRRRSLAR